MTIDDRIRTLIDHVGITSDGLAAETGIKYSRWTTIRKTGGRARAEEVEALCILYPQFQMWIATGTTLPDAGQISPEIEETAGDYQGTGTDT